jgi:hypothetical protein
MAKMRFTARFNPAYSSSNPEWVSLRTLLLLRDMGLDPTSDEARRAIALVRDNIKWRSVLPRDAAWQGKPFFAGEVEPCINGRVVAIGSYFGHSICNRIETAHFPKVCYIEKRSW